MTQLDQNQLAQIEKAVSVDQFELARRIGQMQMANFVKKFGNVTEIKLLAEIKEAKKYKDLKMMDQSGNWQHVTTWGQFCDCYGVSREKADLDILNLSTFGADFLETSQKIGLGYRDLRKLRALPDDERTLLIEGEAVQTGDKETLIDLIEEMAAKHATEKKALVAENKELKSTAAAKDKIIADKNRKADELSITLNKLQNPTPDQALEIEADNERRALQQQQQAVLVFLNAVSQFNADMNASLEICDNTYVLEQYQANVRMTYQSVAERCNNSGMPISFEEIVNPDWLAELQQHEPVMDAEVVYSGNNSHDGSEA